MRFLKNISGLFVSVAMFGALLTSCEESGLYDVNSPDWLSEKIDSINNSKSDSEEEVLEGMHEDVYTVGAEDFSTGFWTAFSKYYVIPSGEKWHGVLNLSINPNATNTYKNFGLVLTSDDDRGGANYKEYGVIRFDNQPSGNSEWGDHIDRSCVESTLTFNTDTDDGVSKLGGRVVITIDRTDANAFSVTMTNGTVTKTYKPKEPLPNLNADESNENIRAFLVPEGSIINFLESNIEPIGGYTSAEDKNPLSMTLNNVPDEVTINEFEDVAAAMVAAGVTANVEFEQGVSAVVKAEDLMFVAVPDFNTLGEKKLVVIYNKTFKGANCDNPIVATAEFKVVNPIASLSVTQAPTYTQYYFYDNELTNGVERAFQPAGLEVTATYGDGTTGVVDNAKLTFSKVPAKAGEHEVTITSTNGKTTSVKVNVTMISAAASVSNSRSVVGAEDNTSGWWTEFTDDWQVKAGATAKASFTNYCGGSNWNNFVVILRNAAMAEYAVVRADNYGWGAGYDGNPGLVLSGGQDWETWLAAMSGAKVEVYVTNCGNGTADVLAVMHGTDGNTYHQYYLGISTIDPADFQFAMTVDGSHIKF